LLIASLWSLGRPSETILFAVKKSEELKIKRAQLLRPLLIPPGCPARQALVYEAAAASAPGVSDKCLIAECW
jgi:hypothetical protein